MLVDSHCHLDRLDLTHHNGSLDSALQAARALGVEHMLCVSIDLDNFKNVLDIAQRYDNVHASVGIHPTEILAVEPSVSTLAELAQDKKIVAIGETGLDYYRSEGDVEWQRQRFRNHIQAAKTVNKPLIIHTRQARADTINIMREEGADNVGGVMHCFTEDWDTAKKAMDLGFYISFSGIVTFANAKELKDLATKIPLDRMLIETDSPYLAPVPFRGKSNEPAYVRYVAEHIAELRNVPWTTIAEKTTENYFKLFKISNH
jgi:TatD DNase family protein